MPNAHGVQVDWTSIHRELDANEGEFVHLLVDLDGVSGIPRQVAIQIGEALELANAAMIDDDEDELADGQGPLASPIGPIINLDWPGATDDITQAWLAHLAATLTAVGHSGTIRGTRRAELPREIGNSVDLIPAGYLAYELRVPLAPISSRRWLIDDELVQQICDEAAAWVTEPSGDLYFSEDVFAVKVEAAAVADHLLTAMHRSGDAYVVSATERPVTGRSVDLAGTGSSVALKLFNDPSHHAANMSVLRDELLRHAGSLDIGIIRPTALAPRGWGSLDDSRRKPPGISSAQKWVLNRHMWTRFVPDAHAVQVLTRHHLDRANDLTSWDITPLENDRYLVEARDLDGWFTNNGDAEEAVSAQARADFGDMIITTDDIEADPYGWLGGPRPPERD